MNHSPSRIYIVTQGNGARYLVRAVNPKQALYYVARETATARVAEQEDLVRMAEGGPLRVNDARANQPMLLIGGDHDVRAA